MRLAQQLNSNRKTGPSQGGMTMIELLIAITVLAIGMGAMLTVFTAAITHNSQAKTTTAGTMLAQTVLERIAAQPANVVAPIILSDCSPGGPVQWTIATAGAPSPGLGANLIAAPPAPPGYNVGDVDWVNQNYAAVPANYKMQFVVCGNNGRQQTYDVRWNIPQITANSRLITVSARPLNADSATGSGAANLYARPITLRTIGGI